jgi:hypothetical protein
MKEEDCDSRSNGPRISMSRRRFIETVATVVADSQLALARRPSTDCPFRHP